MKEIDLEIRDGTPSKKGKSGSKELGTGQSVMQVEHPAVAGDGAEGSSGSSCCSGCNDGT
jgi:hypothetical protein